MNNVVTGEYHIVVPRTDGQGGTMTYSRVYVGDVDGPDGTLVAQYEIRQVGVTAAGVKDINFKGWQMGLDGDIQPVPNAQPADDTPNAPTDTINLPADTQNPPANAPPVPADLTPPPPPPGDAPPPPPPPGDAPPPPPPPGDAPPPPRICSPPLRSQRLPPVL